MASEAGYGDAAPLRRAFSAGAPDHAECQGFGVRALWRDSFALARRVLARLIETSHAVLWPGAAMAAPVKPDPTAGSAGEEQSEADRSGTGASEPPPEKRPPVAPEGVAVQRHGNAELLELLRNEPVTMVLQPGEILFKEGDPGSTMYVVRSGVLRIRSGSVVYEDVAAGGIVGEMALVEKHMPRSATIYALQAAEMIEIDEARFGQLVERRPSFAITVMRVLSRRLRYMDRRYRLEGMP